MTATEVVLMAMSLALGQVSSTDVDACMLASSLGKDVCQAWESCDVNLLQHRALASVRAQSSAEQQAFVGGAGGKSTLFRNGLVILMRTGGPGSADRLRACNETWAQGFMQGPQSKVVTFLDQPAIQEDCKADYGDNHDKGLTCLEAKNELSLLQRTDFTWVFVIDDDVYVNIPNLEEAIGSLDPKEQRVWGVPGCGNCQHNLHGICGGAGYLISRQNLQRMASHEGVFLAEFLHEPDQIWADVRFACVAQLNHMELARLPGLYTWHINEMNEDQAVYSSHVSPLSFHYMMPDRMRNLHAKFTNMTKNTGLLEDSPHRAQADNRYLQKGITLDEYWSMQYFFVDNERAFRMSK